MTALAHGVKQLQKEAAHLNRAHDHYAELARLRDYRTRAKNRVRKALRRLKPGR